MSNKKPQNVEGNKTLLAENDGLDFAVTDAFAEFSIAVTPAKAGFQESFWEP